MSATYRDAVLSVLIVVFLIAVILAVAAHGFHPPVHHHWRSA